MTLLHVDKIEVVYTRVITAIQGVTLSVGERQIVALLGTNGAGKTTTLRAISGFLGIDDARVTDGSITFAGAAIANRLPHEIAGRGVVLVPEREKVFPNLTVAENLAAPVARTGRAERRIGEEAYHFFPRLTELRHRIAGLLSGGERQMLAIAGALMCRPRLLLVDELSLGLAPVVVQDLIRRLVQIRDELGSASLLGEPKRPRRPRRRPREAEGPSGRAGILSRPEWQQPALIPRGQAISPISEVVWLSSKSIGLRCASAG